MGRIDRSNGQDKVMERRHIEQMLRYADEYDAVKSRKHEHYKTATAFYEGKSLCKQNFLKYYRRYINSGRKVESLIPHKTGRKFKDIIKYEHEVTESLKDLRKLAYNKYDIKHLIKAKMDISLSPSSIYRLMKKLGVNKLNPQLKELKRKIIKMEAGELGHIDIHYVTKGTVKELGSQKLYLLGIIDSYSRILWTMPILSIKSLDVSYATMEMLLLLSTRYGVTFKEMLSDNGVEFSSRNNTANHPFEKLMQFLEIKHRYTKPATPKTNGKIERFWKTLENELLSGETFDTLDEFTHYIKGYCIYYNEHRMHQGINLKKPVDLAPCYTP